MQSDEKTIDTPVLDIGFMCTDVLIQCSSVVLKLTLSHPHLRHLGLVSRASFVHAYSFPSV